MNSLTMRHQNETPLRKKIMKAKVIKNLIKAGFNEESVNKMVDAQFNYVVATYPEAKPAKVADIISTLWSMS